MRMIQYVKWLFRNMDGDSWFKVLLAWSVFGVVAVISCGIFATSTVVLTVLAVWVGVPSTIGLTIFTIFIITEIIDSWHEFTRNNPTPEEQVVRKLKGLE